MKGAATAHVVLLARATVALHFIHRPPTLGGPVQDQLVRYGCSTRLSEPFGAIGQHIRPGTRLASSGAYGRPRTPRRRATIGLKSQERKGDPLIEDAKPRLVQYSSDTQLDGGRYPPEVL